MISIGSLLLDVISFTTNLKGAYRRTINHVDALDGPPKCLAGKRERLHKISERRTPSTDDPALWSTLVKHDGGWDD
jgi:hypothetical protein